jgi:hypothetical protein
MGRDVKSFLHYSRTFLRFHEAAPVLLRSLLQPILVVTSGMQAKHGLRPIDLRQLIDVARGVRHVGRHNQILQSARRDTAQI